MTAADTDTSNAELKCPHPALRKIGWAGLLMDCPINWRFARVQGHTRQGQIIMADHERPRFEISWGRVRRANYDGRHFAMKRLRKRTGLSNIEADVSEVKGSSYKPLLWYKDPNGKQDRYAGYHPISRRVVEIAYHPGSATDDKLVREYLMPGMRDQSAILPHHWAFFDVSFTAPAGFRYESSRLNLGDMRVRLISGTRVWNGPRITLGQIYPASLALQRQDVTQWVRNLAAEIRSHYRPSKGKVLEVKFYDSPQGRVAMGDLKLRRRFWPFLWRTTKLLRLYVIHHESLNRLTFLNISDVNMDRIEEHFEFISESLHWAGLQR